MGRAVAGNELRGYRLDALDAMGTAPDGTHLVQTLCRPSRLHEFEPGEFDVIFTDESHHALAPTTKGPATT